MFITCYYYFLTQANLLLYLLLILSFPFLLVKVQMKILSYGVTLEMVVIRWSLDIGLVWWVRRTMLLWVMTRCGPRSGIFKVPQNYVTSYGELAKAPFRCLSCCSEDISVTLTCALTVVKFQNLNAMPRLIAWTLVDYGYLLQLFRWYRMLLDSPLLTSSYSSKLTLLRMRCLFFAHLFGHVG